MDEAAVDSGPAWKYAVKSFELSGFRSALSDRKANPKKPLYQIQKLRLRVTDIDGRSPMEVALGFGAAQRGDSDRAGQGEPSGPVR